MKLSVISVLMILYTVVCDHVGHWAAVDGEQYRSENRTFRYSDHQLYF